MSDTLPDNDALPDNNAETEVIEDDSSTEEPPKDPPLLKEKPVLISESDWNYANPIASFENIFADLMEAEGLSRYVERARQLESYQIVLNKLEVQHRNVLSKKPCVITSHTEEARRIVSQCRDCIEIGIW